MLANRDLNVSSASGHSKSEAFRRKGGLNRDDSGIFSASPSPLTPSRSLNAFPQSPLMATADTMNASRGQTALTGSGQDGSPITMEGKSNLTDFANSRQEQDSLIQAFSCCTEIGFQHWAYCDHAHCKSIRHQWQHLSSCPQRNSTQSCDQCTAFQKLVLVHALHCLSDDCVVTLCPDAKKQLSKFSVLNTNPQRQFHRSNSFSASRAQPKHLDYRQESYDDSLVSPSASQTYLQSLQELNRLGVGALPVNLVMSYDKRAEQILSQLEKEMSFELNMPPSDSFAVKSGIPVASPLPAYPAPMYAGVPSALSPIEEQPTPVASPSGLLEDIPRQSILHQLDPTYLTAGGDGLYLHPRDYYLNEHLGTGGFGTCAAANDRQTGELFVVKTNKHSEKSMIDSLRAECSVLSRLSHHENIIRFLGAVLEEDGFTGSQTCRLMMELAEHGSLADMLKDDEGGFDSLPLDQSLFYLQQILQGVFYLHSCSVLHLDIKAENVLVLDGGRRVKLADFGTAVHVDEVAGAVSKLKGCTPHFTAPEIIKGEMPTFASDIWSVICVLIQMITAQPPGCFDRPMTRENMLYMVGNYTNDKIEQLIPLSQIESMDDEVTSLFRDVLAEDPRKRPNALQLLSYPAIVNACQYEEYFDMDFSQEAEQPVEEQGVGHSLESYVTPPTSLRLPISGECDDDVSLDFPVKKKFSQDSGVSSPLNRMSSQTSTVRMDSAEDSGMDTPGMENYRQLKLRGIMKQEMILEDREGEEEHYSIPERAFSHPETSLDIVSLNQYRRRAQSATYRRHPPNWEGVELPHGHAHYDETEGSHSLPSTVNEESLCERLERLGYGVSHQKQRPNFVPLIHSHSAPVVMTEGGEMGRVGRRGESFRGKETENKAPERLRRSSSEVYVERGPDIDTPEEKKKRELELAKQAEEREQQAAMATVTMDSNSGQSSLNSHSTSSLSNYSPPSGGTQSSDSQSDHNTGYRGYTRRPTGPNAAGGNHRGTTQYCSTKGIVRETLV